MITEHQHNDDDDGKIKVFEGRWRGDESLSLCCFVYHKF
jgi:hypothetical protein